MTTIELKDNYLEGLGTWTAGAGADWLRDLRTGAMGHFRDIGFPTPKMEAWKYTDLTTLFRDVFSWEDPGEAGIAVSARLKALSFDTEGSHIVVFVNGKFAPRLSSLRSLPRGVKLQNLSKALAGKAAPEKVLGSVLPYEGRALTALNTALFKDGLYLNVPDGKVLRQPVHAVYVSSNPGASAASQSHIRNLVVLGEDSSAALIEHYWGETGGPYLTNAVTEVSLASGSSLDHTKVQRESLNGYHVGTLAADQREGSRLTARLFSVGGSFARNEVEADLKGKRAECSLDGLYLASGRQHVDNRVLVDHLAPACVSGEVFKGVVDGEATAIFDGRILVRENSQKTDARQVNRNLQLSKTAKVYSKPQLMIYADDVKCSHGSSTGQLDEEALFYFQSRGIGREEARRVLVYAFAAEMVERVASESLRTPLREMVGEWMASGREARP